MNDTTANKAVTQAQEAYKQMLEAYDAEVRQEVRKEIDAALETFLNGLEDASKSQLDAIYNLREKLMDKPPAAPAKRHRTRFKATKAEVESVKTILHNIGQFTFLPVDGIAKMANLEPRITANACEQLEQQGWIKGSGLSGDSTYQWISEREAEELNGPRMIDDIKEQDEGQEIE